MLIKTKFLFLIIVLSLGINITAQTLKKDIRVASYNIRMDTPKDSLDSWSNRKESVKQLIKFHDLDLIGTQEGFFHQINDLLELSDYSYIGKGRDDGKSSGEHSAIFYKKERFQLLDSGDFWLREESASPGKGWDATCCNRISSWGKFHDKNSTKDFYLFNVHFDHQGIIARRESSKLMVKKIKEIAKNHPVILTGDFNSLPSSEIIKTIKENMKDSYDISKAPPYGPIGTFNGFNFSALLKDRIDYIFVKNNITVKKYGVITDFKNGHFPSDHLPVLIDLEIY